jgi:pyruvate/2-oxoglutarate dehydrogenase complex dihydrolipoamide dehydrogenase (E3) component
MNHNETYDLAVVGAGTGGLVSSFVASSLGAKTVLIERDKMGGECLWTGCVPSKMLIKSARVYETVKRAEEFGVHLEKPRLVWGAVRMRIAAVRDEIRALERAEFERAGIEFVNGEARFEDACTLRVQEKSDVRYIRARKFILATGTRARVPAIEGLTENGYLTHETIFDLTSLPRQLLLLGGGPIACELAQAFRRFGSQVTIIQQSDRLLPKEDVAISAACQRLMQQEGVTVHLGAQAMRVGRDEEKHFVEYEAGDGSRQREHYTRLLVAVGKEPAFDSLNLEAAGVATNKNGIVVDDYLKTTARHVWACGDATGKYLFTHVAEYQGKLAARNALLPLKAKADYRVVPWTTFTDPEISHLGLTEEEAEREHGSVKVYETPFKTLDRAIIEGETFGFLKVVASGSGRILGAHIIGPAAGELIHSFVPAVRDGALLQEMAETIHVYPTLAEIGHCAGNEYYRDLLASETVRGVLRLIHRGER